VVVGAEVGLEVVVGADAVFLEDPLQATKAAANKAAATRIRIPEP
jgi:hypothetical protein